MYKYVEKRSVSGLVGPVSSVGNCSTMLHPLYRYQASNFNDIPMSHFPCTLHVATYSSFRRNTTSSVQILEQCSQLFEPDTFPHQYSNTCKHRRPSRTGWTRMHRHGQGVDSECNNLAAFQHVHGHTLPYQGQGHCHQY